MFDFVPKLFWIYNETTISTFRGAQYKGLPTSDNYNKVIPIQNLSALTSTDYIINYQSTNFPYKVWDFTGVGIYYASGSNYYSIPVGYMDGNTYHWYVMSENGGASLSGNYQYNALNAIYYWIAIG